MTGEQLYALYTQANIDVGCGVDEWNDLDPLDREMWNALGAKVQEIE